MTVFESTVPGSRPARYSPPAWAQWVILYVGVGLLELAAQHVPGGPIRAVVALPGILFIPGFSLLALFLGHARPRDPAALGVFSFVLSLGLLMLDALLLNAARVKLDTESLGLTLLCVTGALMATATALGRRVDAPLATRTRAEARPGAACRCAAFVAAVAIAAGTVVIVAKQLPTPTAPPFASLALGGKWASEGAAPTVHTGEIVDIPVVAKTDGSAAGEHVLTTTVDGTVTATLHIYLGTKSSWSGPVTVAVPAGRQLHKVSISLGSIGSSDSTEQVIVYLNNDAN